MKKVKYELLSSQLLQKPKVLTHSAHRQPYEVMSMLAGCLVVGAGLGVLNASLLATSSLQPMRQAENAQDAQEISESSLKVGLPTVTQPYSTRSKLTGNWSRDLVVGLGVSAANPNPSADHALHPRCLNYQFLLPATDCQLLHDLASRVEAKLDRLEYRVTANLSRLEYQVSDLMFITKEKLQAHVSAPKLWSQVFHRSRLFVKNLNQPQHIFLLSNSLRYSSQMSLTDADLQEQIQAEIERIDSPDFDPSRLDRLDSSGLY